LENMEASQAQKTSEGEKENGNTMNGTSGRKKGYRVRRKLGN